MAAVLLANCYGQLAVGMVLCTSNAQLMSFVFISKYAKTLRYLNLFYVQYVYILLLHK